MGQDAKQADMHIGLAAAAQVQCRTRLKQDAEQQAQVA